MKKYTHLIFDLDNTLLDFNDTEEQALNALFAHYQVPANPATMQTYQTINQSLWHDLEDKKIERNDIFKRRFNLLFKEFNLQIDGIEAEAFYREKINQGHKIIHGANLVLEDLKQKGYRIYAGTNGVGHTQRQRLLDAKLLPYFDDLFISEEIGVEKPDTAFFQHIFDTVKASQKKDFLMIGDSVSSDITGAQKAGIDSVWLTSNIEQANHGATHVITDLNQISQLL